MMYGDREAWPLLMEKLVEVLVAYARQQVEAGADVIQIFDSWAGALGVTDYREYCLGPTTELVRRSAGAGGSGDLLRRGHGFPAADDARDGRGCDWAGLASSAG